MKAINAAIRAAGVVWHGCDFCGIEWPFPKGHTLNREWRCANCAGVQWARAVRLLAVAKAREAQGSTEAPALSDGENKN